MTERDWYKGTPESTTVLAFGEVFADRPPITTALLVGREAYETYQTKAYLDGLLRTRSHPTYVDWSPLFSACYAGILVTGAEHVIEIGSTLFATIDKLDKLQRLSGAPHLNCAFVGIEPSDLFRQLAEALHSGRPVTHHTDLSQIVVPPRSVSRCYQSTSYAFETTADLIDHCAQFQFGSHGVWCSVDGQTRTASVLGKRLTLFSLPEFVSGMTTRGFRVEFVSACRSCYDEQFEFEEVWLLYHRFTAAEHRMFRSWLDVFQQVTGDNSSLFASVDQVPRYERAASGFSGLDESRILDFTTPQAVRRLAEWKQSLATSR
jgi:hypothetical protein